MYKTFKNEKVGALLLFSAIFTPSHIALEERTLNCHKIFERNLFHFALLFLIFHSLFVRSVPFVLDSHSAPKSARYFSPSNLIFAQSFKIIYTKIYDFPPLIMWVQAQKANESQVASSKRKKALVKTCRFAQ